MSGFEPIFIDSVGFIYLVEAHPEYSSKVYRFIVKEAGTNENLLITSVLTIAEFSVKPYRENLPDLTTEFHRVLEEFHFSIFDVNKSIALLAAQLRARYMPLKTIDALQLATAISFGAKKFLTNDKDLKKVKEINIILISELP